MPIGAMATASAPWLASDGDAISGRGRPSTTLPVPTRRGRWPWVPEYSFKLGPRDAFCRVDFEYQSRNPWLSPVQDPQSSQYIPLSYTLSSTHFTSLRGGVTNFGDMAADAVHRQPVRLHTVTNYALGQLDRTAPTFTPQQNAYTFRPRTIRRHGAPGAHSR